MSQTYRASDIEVLSGLEPVRRRPGMYTDTSRPNHLAHEVIDNSVDEALSGHCKRSTSRFTRTARSRARTTAAACRWTSIPRRKCSGVELILTRLHAGGKFSDKNYQFSGGLHGVGVSVVNALSKNLEVWVRRTATNTTIALQERRASCKLEPSARWPAREHRHHSALLAGSEVLRLRQVLGASARARAARPRRCCVRACASRSRSRSTGEERTNGSILAALSSTSWREVDATERFPQSRSGPDEGEQRPGGLGVAVGAGRRQPCGRELRQPHSHGRRAARTRSACAPAWSRRCASSASFAICCPAA